MKIVDNNDCELPTGEVGELVVRGWPVMVGYYKEPELTREVMRGGWLHTGDLASFEADGYLYIRGRKKDMIIVGGLNVYSPEVERVIHNFPGVKEVAVVGIPDRLRGEAIKAVVVMEDGYQEDAAEIKSFCRRHLIHYKIPQVIEFRKTSLPKSRTGKVQKELLKQ
jgi:acyl-CoA synthetase (AMP-forming)/AMP-acid ligase II